MLILTRKLGESINIGEDIKISVLAVHGRQVRLGIEAPLNVVIHREEIYIKIQEENRKASKSLAKDMKRIVDLVKRKFKGKGKNQLKPPVIDYKDKFPRGKKNSRYRGSKNKSSNPD